MAERAQKRGAWTGEARSAEFRATALQSARQCIGRLVPGCRIIGLTKGQFSLLDLIRAVLETTGPASVVASTWSTGVRDAENAAWLVETGQITSLRLITDRSFPGRHPEYAAWLVRAFGPAAIHCTRVHAKIAIIRAPGWSVCIRSSMNLNRNPRFEQFDLDDDESICEFFETWVREIETTHPPGVQFDEAEAEAAFQAALGGTVEEHRDTRWADLARW